MFTGQGHEEEKKLEKSFDKNKEKKKKKEERYLVRPCSHECYIV
jgi:hypothetical protein